MKSYNVLLEFTEPFLGTVPKDEEIYTSYIKSKADHAADDELKTLKNDDDENDLEKGCTGFHMLDGNPILYNYVIKGFFKDACGMIRRVPKTASKNLTSYKKIIDGLVFVRPRQIPINLSGEMGMLERPLRASTPKGERVALAKSETCPAGSTLHIEVDILGVVSDKHLSEWLDYGMLRGLGQWRNAGYGSFDYSLAKIE